eukprot:1302748-Pleurochrysis_carterae.AAC.1
MTGCPATLCPPVLTAEMRTTDRRLLFKSTVLEPAVGSGGKFAISFESTTGTGRRSGLVVLCDALPFRTDEAIEGGGGGGGETGERGESSSSIGHARESGGGGLGGVSTSTVER